MSVAFRRDSDEEHLEPKFEIPIPAGPNMVTPHGLALIQAKVAELEAALPLIEDETQIVAAKRDLRYWRARQATAQLAPAPDGATVEFGCSVRFRRNGKAQAVTLVGHDEAEPASGLISFSAPLSQALMRAEVGDFIAFGGQEDAIEILAITVADRP
jgi:transcription elongation GreA/GreB family factor